MSEEKYLVQVGRWARGYGEGSRPEITAVHSEKHRGKFSGWNIVFFLFNMANVVISWLTGEGGGWSTK